MTGAELTVENRGAGDMGLRRVGDGSDTHVYLFRLILCVYRNVADLKKRQT